MAGGHAWQGGMHGRGACMVGGACMAGQHAWQGRACIGGPAWQGGMCGGRGMHGRYYKIRSMSGWYASYWNAFLFLLFWLAFDLSLLLGVYRPSN